MKTGLDVRVSPHAAIANPDLVEIGNHVAIDPFTVITVALTLGNYIHIAPHCSIIGGRNGRLIMEDFSSMAAGCRIICSTDDYSGEGLNGAAIPLSYRKVTFTTITIRQFASLATNVVLLPGITVGEGAVAAAGAVVNRDLEPWGIYIGSPVRRVGTRKSESMRALAAKLKAERGES